MWRELIWFFSQPNLSSITFSRVHHIMRTTTLISALALALSAGLASAQSIPTDSGPPSGSVPDTSTSSSSVTLVGTSVTIGYYYNDLATALASSTVAVDSSAVEVTCPDSTMALCSSTNGTDAGLLDGEYIDIGSNTISGRLLASFGSSDGDTFNGLIFSGLNFGTGYAITGFTLSTNISGLDASDISFTATTLSINLLGLDPGNTTDGTGIGTYTITLQVSAVPEPASAALISVGLGALIWVGRRKQLG
jgi:hypothetical protein